VIIPGLLQAPAYARALFEAMGESDAKTDALVKARFQRQTTTDHDESASLRAVLDDAVLRRCVASPQVMHQQLMFLAQRAKLHNAGVQLTPAENGAKAGCVGAIPVASVAGKPDVGALEESRTR
jgi:hypothetical protein